MKQTNNSIFTRVLALILCLMMIVGTLSACLLDTDINSGVGESTSTEDSATTVKPEDTTTGDSAEKEPEEDPVDPNEIFSASTEITEEALILGTLANDVLIGGEEGMSALLPADVKIAEGTSSLALSVKKVEEEIALPLGEGDTAQSLDVHIDGIALDNTVPMIVNLGAVLEAGLGETELKFYHIENGVAQLMTRVASVSDFAIHNQYYYNAETGEVTIYVASFSVFSAVQTTTSILTAETAADTSWYDASKTSFTLKDAADFIGFRNLVDEGTTFEGKTVTLGVDIDLNNINFDPIGYGYAHLDGQVFKGTFDGADHTIYNLYMNGWDLETATGKDYTYSTAGAGLFASIMGTEENPAVIKNLAVSGANIKMECVDMGIVVGYAQGVCHFENIVVTNSKIANYQRATGGVVGEVCFGPYGVDTTLGYSHTFKNITVDSSVTVGSLWGDFDNLTGGVIGGKWGDATVNMENVTVAATLDVYSDVTSAYQWYAYRRCGMLIGYTEQESPKQATTAAAEFLTCSNVKVYYGDWVNYTYCEFEHTNNPGYRYPWVRVQVGLNNGAYSNPRYGNPIDSEGNKVTTDEHKHADGEGCKVSIPFNQLYGGGQGVYGEHEHAGVAVEHKLTKTVYFENKYSWSNVYVYYWYEHSTKVGDETEIHAWNNVSFPGTAMTRVGNTNIYTFEMPAYATGFVFNNGTAVNVANHIQSVDVMVSEVLDGYIYCPIQKIENDTKVLLGADKYATGYQTHEIYLVGVDGEWNPKVEYKLTVDGEKWIGQFTIAKETSVKMFNSKAVSNGGWINPENTSDDLTLVPGTYYFEYFVNGNYFAAYRLVYLKAGGWTVDSARFAAYVWIDGGCAKH